MTFSKERIELGKLATAGIILSGLLIWAALIPPRYDAVNVSPPWKAPAPASAAGMDSKTVTASFEECQATKERTITQLGVAPRDIITIVNTSAMTMTRICTSDGSVLITCTGGKMAITRSPHSADVGCR